jgi:hypothetical protein
VRRTRQRHAAEQATAIAAGLLGPNLLFGLLWVAGARPGWVLPVWLSLAGAVVGAVVVDARVRRIAGAERATRPDHDEPGQRRCCRCWR